MENKRWSFKVPGDTNGREKIIDTSEIRSVYDLLDILRKGELQPPEKEQSTRLNNKPKAVLIPFISRMIGKDHNPPA